MTQDTHPFRPRGWLSNPHLQSVLASSGLRRALASRRRARIEGAAEAVLLDCGDGVRLLGYHTRQSLLDRPRGLAVLLHGWEGSVQSTYLIHTGARLLEEGFDVFRLNLRDHGDTHHLNVELFHSCRIDEVVGALGEIARYFPQRPICLAGYSLGGNFTLRCALRAPAAHIPLAKAVAICPVISPAAGLQAIESAPWFYQAYFLRKWRASLARKAKLFPKAFDFTDWYAKDDLRELTRKLVQRYTDFPTLEQYLDGYSIAGDRLSTLSVSSSILTAADDPIIPLADFLRLELPDCARLEIAPHGGHCGFLPGLRGRSYAEDFIAAEFAQVAVA
ncbi:YheT family hydrolase [Pseudomarimonas arenosa]|uniref:Alpha/beta fold hydrolase n=1 Tax=Pseudomarimonas arenosa TaxID=2774145 RepID=A0AAW3ZQ70_9GAMM|nr:alpha/beta fold hydrolase [Pseudomarimonas arenosa]MBD8526747.1 alpha/beta fold hydrolase [Pseudomarimonas arenosa]